MMLVRLILFTGIVFLSFTKSFSQERDVYLEELIARTIEVSPSLKALRFKQKISESKIPQVSNLPDPLLKVGLANLPTNSFSLTQEPMTGKIVGLSQMIPFPGKLSAAENVQSKDVEINQQEIDDKVNELKSEVSKLYFDLRFMRQAIIIAEKNKKLLKTISDVVKTKYTVNKASQQNVIKIEVELTRLKDKIEQLVGTEKGIIAALNSLLMNDVLSEIKTGEIPEITSQDLLISDLIELSKENRPFLKGIKISEAKAVAMKDLAEYEFYPNFNFSVQYNQREGISRTNTDLNDFLSFTVGINLPINYGGKKTAKIDQAKGLQSLYANQYEAAVQFLTKVIGKSLAVIEQLKKRENIIAGGLLPQANQALEAALSGYQVNEIDFLNVIEAQAHLFSVELDLFKIRTEYYKTISDLEFFTGIKL